MKIDYFILRADYAAGGSWTKHCQSCAALEESCRAEMTSRGFVFEGEFERLWRWFCKAAQSDGVHYSIISGSAEIPDRRVEVTIEGGNVQDVNADDGIEVVVMDYDTDGCDEGVKTDGDGRKYWESVWK